MVLLLVIDNFSISKKKLLKIMAIKILIADFIQLWNIKCELPEHFDESKILIFFVINN